MNFDPKTFCSAPWFQVRNEQFGQYKPCPIINEKLSQFDQKNQYHWPEHTPEEYLQSEYSVYLRKNLTEGVRLPECRKCWDQEDAGNYSVRQELNNTISNNRGNDLNKSWIKPYLDQKSDYSFDHLIRADVKLTNVCNFSCSMCGPSDSSQIYAAWSSNQSIPIIKSMLDVSPGLLQAVRDNYKDKNNHRLLELLLQQNPKYLKLLGGEPLLDKQALSILENCKNKKISLLFVTNGSVDLVDISQRLKDFQDVNYVISLDGIGSVQDYIRKGSNWSFISDNIDRWLTAYPNKKLAVHTTVQALNIGRIKELFAWAQTRNINLGVNVLTSPDFLSLSVIPAEVRNNLDVPGEFALDVKLEKAIFDPQLLAKFKNYLAWYDPDQKWRNVFPEWISVL